jgi:hypothetical protein
MRLPTTLRPSCKQTFGEEVVHDVNSIYDLPTAVLMKSRKSQGRLKEKFFVTLSPSADRRFLPA